MVVVNRSTVFAAYPEAKTIASTVACSSAERLPAAVSDGRVTCVPARSRAYLKGQETPGRVGPLKKHARRGPLQSYPFWSDGRWLRTCPSAIMMRMWYLHA